MSDRLDEVGTERPASMYRIGPDGEPPIALAVVAALAAALVGAVAWGLVARWTGYEAGIVAWGVGILCGAAVRLAARGHRTGALQAIAVVAAGLGIAIGKYLAFAFVIQDESGADIGVFSSEMWRLFWDNLSDVFSLFDLLWIALALASALMAVRFETGEAREGTYAAEQDARRRRSRNPIAHMTHDWPRGWRIFIDWVVTIAGAIAIVLAIKAWVVNPYRIPSSSMEPTLHCARPGSGCESRFSDRVLANRFIYHFRKPSRGDIIVFKTPPETLQKCGAGGTFVKRLIAMPGETWEEKNGFVYIDGKKLIEPYVDETRRDTSTSWPPRKVPPGGYFMMGDNRSQSCDSREWGPVPRANLIGSVFAVYWPPNRIGFR